MPKGVKYGGRQKGSLNKITADIKALAQVHGPMAIAGIVELTKAPENAVRMAAFKELLDRGYGRPAQATVISGDPNAPIEHRVVHSFESKI